MVAQKNLPHLAPEQYLERERQAETKSEYYDGVVVAMAGASRAHNILTLNIGSELRTHLRGTPCRAYINDMRVRVSDVNRYYYPDVSVTCGEEQFEDTGVDTLLNPIVVVEVLSESTEKTDRGDKLFSYQTLASLRAYVLVAQHTPRIEVYTRLEGDNWHYRIATGLDAVLNLSCIASVLKFAEIYAGIEFAALSRTTNQ